MFMIKVNSFLYLPHITFMQICYLCDYRFVTLLLMCILITNLLFLLQMFILLADLSFVADVQSMQICHLIADVHSMQICHLIADVHSACRFFFPFLLYINQSLGLLKYFYFSTQIFNSL